jgi:hypothetical protein
MRRLSPKQRGMLGEKLADLGNIAVGSLVFGVVLRAEAFTLGGSMDAEASTTSYTENKRTMSKLSTHKK